MDLLKIVLSQDPRKLLELTEVLLDSATDKKPDFFKRDRKFIAHLKDGVTPAIGSVVVCDLSVGPPPLLGAVADHSGIYVGEGKIIHRDGDGYLEMVEPEKFLRRFNGLNYAFNIYVACEGDTPIGNPEAARRAINALFSSAHPEHSGYHLLDKNCHHFTRYCLTGESSQEVKDFTFSGLEVILEQTFHKDNWRIWKSEKIWSK